MPTGYFANPPYFINGWGFAMKNPSYVPQPWEDRWVCNDVGEALYFGLPPSPELTARWNKGQAEIAARDQRRKSEVQQKEPGDKSRARFVETRKRHEINHMQHQRKAISRI